jgi:UDPglucose 6-dehydrogenase
VACENGERATEAANQARQANLIFTTDIAKSMAEADMIFIAVNTPTKTTGLGAGFATDMTALGSSVEAIASHAKSGAILVEKSTVPCRTAELIQEMVRLTPVP